MSAVIPMFALTGYPQKAEIEREIQAFRSVGIREVMLYPRSGCTVPYLSEEWFALIGCTVAICKENGMSVWLYDEFNWPSGSCVNRVQKTDVHFWSKKMMAENNAVKIVSDSRYPDLLNPDAVQTFIRLTHEPYYAHFSDLFGTVIRGIFTDEPSFVYSCIGTDTIPYYDGMEQAYKALCGGDLFEDTARFYNGCAPDGYTTRVYDLLGARMKSTYIGTLADWCERHGVLLTGHLLNDGDVNVGTSSNGNVLHVLEALHVPGIDDIETKIGGSSLVAYAHIDRVKRNKGGETMIELFALGPCNMTYNRKKRSLYMAAAFGISRYFLAVAHLDARGNYYKRQYFNAECSMTPDYASTALLCKQAEKAAAYAAKQAVTDVYVEYPREQMLAYRNRQRKELCGAAERVLEALFTDLLCAQVSFAFTESGKEPHVLCVSADGVFDKHSGEKVTSVKAWCDSRIERRVRVFEDGKPADGVFVKTYTDGSFLLADCTEENGKKRTVEIEAFGKRYRTVLYPRDVLLPEDLTRAEELSAATPSFAVSFATGMMRAYLWEAFPFEVKEPTQVRFLIRNYPQQKPVFLDGTPLRAERDCDILGTGWDGLYKMSEPMQLTAGSHVLQAEDGEKEERVYLPLCMAAGTFESVGNVIRRQPEHGDSAYFYGSCSFTAELYIPEGATRVRFETKDFYTRLLINGEPIGESAQSLAVLSLPGRLGGTTATFAFIQYSSLAPLFGETENDYCVSHQHNGQRGWQVVGFGTKQKPGGIGKITFEKEA